MTVAREPIAGTNAGESGDVQLFVRTGLKLLELEASEAEIAVIEAADALYRPHMERLLAAELNSVDPEPGTDMSRPPA